MTPNDKLREAMMLLRHLRDAADELMVEFEGCDARYDLIKRWHRMKDEADAFLAREVQP